MAQFNNTGSGMKVTMHHKAKGCKISITCQTVKR